MADSDQERTEEATDQRRDEFRRRGQVAHTRELASVFLLFGMALICWALGRFFMKQLIEVVSHSLTDFFTLAARQGEYKGAVQFAVLKAFMVLGPLLGILGVLSVMANVLQTGLLNNEDALTPDFERINPVAGMQKLFSLRSLIEGFKATLKVSLVMVVAYMILRDEIPHLALLVGFEIPKLMVYIGTLTLKLLGGIGLFMLILAGFDYLYNRWDLERRMRMTRAEIKEEHKSLQGDPQIKARIRRLQRDLANKRMMEDVPKADVVITNPTHIAVVLKYSETMVAPQIVAMGADLIAEKIKDIARAHNVPIVENKPLARTMYKTLKIGQTIPRELFTAVAQVLSYVYRLKKKVIR